MVKKHTLALKCTPELTKRICKDIEEGVPVEHAARVNGVTGRTVFRWLEDGAKDGPDADVVFVTFRQAIEQAKSNHAAALSKALHRAAVKKGKPDAKAMQFVLERRDRENWGLRVSLEVDKELAVIAARVEKAFDGEPELVERILLALSGGET